VIILKEEFKVFVRTKPELVSYVSSGEMTWQKFYEIWNLYGNDEKVWEKYKEKNINESKKTSDSFSFSSLMDSVKKIDMNSVQKGINSMQKAIELLQGLTIGKAPSNAASTYQPRQVFKKFED
jgi:hypothetical protein